MKFYKDSSINKFDVGIYGIGYESRAISAALTHQAFCDKKIAIGYDYYNDVFSYKKNESFYKKNKYFFLNTEDNHIVDILKNELDGILKTKKLDILIDITVMSRHRLATVIWFFLCELTPGSTLTIVYSLSKFLASPQITPPAKKVGCIIDQLNGSPGNIGYPTSLILSLGYEQNKALGAVNYIDPDSVYIFVPRSEESKFESEVLLKNEDLLKGINNSYFIYNVHQPYSTYLDLKLLCIEILKDSRPIFLPLGPKIIAALGVILGKDLYPTLPVWRVSSVEAEQPADRIFSGHSIKFTIEL